MAIYEPDLDKYARLYRQNNDQKTGPQIGSRFISNLTADDVVSAG